MSVEEQAKSVVRAYVAAFNRGDLAALQALLAPGAQIQVVRGAGVFERVAPVWRQLIEGYGMQLSLEELIAEGNVVAARYTKARHVPRAGLRPRPHRALLRARRDGVVRDRQRQDQPALGGARWLKPGAPAWPPARVRPQEVRERC